MATISELQFLYTGDVKTKGTPVWNDVKPTCTSGAVSVVVKKGGASVTLPFDSITDLGAGDKTAGAKYYEIKYVNGGDNLTIKYEAYTYVDTLENLQADLGAPPYDVLPAYKAFYSGKLGAKVIPVTPLVSTDYNADTVKSNMTWFNLKQLTVVDGGDTYTLDISYIAGNDPTYERTPDSYANAVATGTAKIIPCWGVTQAMISVGMSPNTCKYGNLDAKGSFATSRVFRFNMNTYLMGYDPRYDAKTAWGDATHIGALTLQPMFDSAAWVTTYGKVGIPNTKTIWSLSGQKVTPTSQKLTYWVDDICYQMENYVSSLRISMQAGELIQLNWTCIAKPSDVQPLQAHYIFEDGKAPWLVDKTDQQLVPDTLDYSEVYKDISGSPLRAMAGDTTLTYRWYDDKTKLWVDDHPNTDLTITDFEFDQGNPIEQQMAIGEKYANADPQVTALRRSTIVFTCQEEDAATFDFWENMQIGSSDGTNAAPQTNPAIMSIKIVCGTETKNKVTLEVQFQAESMDYVTVNGIRYTTLSCIMTPSLPTAYGTEGTGYLNLTVE